MLINFFPFRNAIITAIRNAITEEYNYMKKEDLPHEGKLVVVVSVQQDATHLVTISQQNFLIST